MRDRLYDDVMIERFRKDPKYAVSLMNSILEDGDEIEVSVILRLMTGAFGNAKQPSPASDGAAAFTNFLAPLRSLGLRLSVTQAPREERVTLEEMTEQVEHVEKGEMVGV